MFVVRGVMKVGGWAVAEEVFQGLQDLSTTMLSLYTHVPPIISYPRWEKNKPVGELVATRCIP